MGCSAAFGVYCNPADAPRAPTYPTGPGPSHFDITSPSSGPASGLATVPRVTAFRSGSPPCFCLPRAVSAARRFPLGRANGLSAVIRGVVLGVLSGPAAGPTIRIEPTTSRRPRSARCRGLAVVFSPGRSRPRDPGLINGSWRWGRPARRRPGVAKHSRPLRGVPFGADTIVYESGRACQIDGRNSELSK